MLTKKPIQPRDKKSLRRKSASAKAQPIMMSQEEVDTMIRDEKKDISIIRAIRKKIKTAPVPTEAPIKPVKKFKPLHIDGKQMTAVKKLGGLPKALRDRRTSFEQFENYISEEQEDKKSKPRKKIKS